MAFIRPDLLRQCLDNLSAIKPSILYISIDGPRNSVEENLVSECKSIALDPGWDCEVVPLFYDNNVGLVECFVNAMNRLFSEHEFGIFLEDDILLSPTFGDFANEIFLRFRDDHRVGHINASNFIPKYEKSNNYSYYFSQYSHVWGFGTWKRMWDKYDLTMKEWKNSNQKRLLKDFCFSWRERIGTKKMFDLHCENSDPWACDYQWQFCLLQNKAFCITPAKNMSLNIGFDRHDSTHTFGDNPFASPLRDIEFPIIHRKDIVRSTDYDRKLSQKMCPSHFKFYLDRFEGKFRKFLKNKS